MHTADATVGGSFFQDLAATSRAHSRPGAGHVMTLRVWSVMATGVVLVTAERRPRFIGEACRID